jgi:predicted phage terminase large subunit-like protein
MKTNSSKSSKGKIHKKKKVENKKVGFYFTEDFLEARLCQTSFSYFVKKFWKVISPETLQWNWHMEFLCDELQEVVDRIIANEPKAYDLVVNISPGTSKSSLASVLLQPWSWTKMPTMRHICGSHTQALVIDLSRKSRSVVESEEYQKLFPYIKLTDDQNTKAHWVNTAGGDRFGCTISGKTPMGIHAHLLTVDDPIDPKKAGSEQELKIANDWMDTTLPSRKVNKAVSATILIMQRLAEDDPAGRLLQRKNVRSILLPAEYTENIRPAYLKKYYRQNPEGLMDPIRMPRSVLDEFLLLGEYYYSGQFLQWPIPIGGGMFKVNRFIMQKIPPRKFRKLVRYWDKAGTLGGGTYTVGLLLGMDMEGAFWVLDVIRGQWDTAYRERRIKEAARRDGKKVTVGLEQEGGSGGKESTENTIRRLAGFAIRVNKPSGSINNKVLRADAWSVQVNFGNVNILEAPWNETFIREHEYFPFGKYKDQVDAATGAHSVLTLRGTGKRVFSA